MKQLNLEQLEYVVEVAKTGSLSKAAQHYYVSLSAVSQAISILEAEMRAEATAYSSPRQSPRSSSNDSTSDEVMGLLLVHWLAEMKLG